MDWIKQYWPHSGNVWDYHEYDSYVIDLSNLQPTTLNPREACKKLVQQIQDQYPAPYYLMLSGGLDSQAMLQVWVESGAEFVPVHFTYNDHWNRADTLSFLEAAKKFSVEPKLLDIDVFDFYERELEDYAREYVCNSPHLTVYMKMADIITDGTVIFSGNPLKFYVPSQGFNYTDYTIMGLHRYGLKSGRSIVPFFFMHSPEVAYAFAGAEPEATQLIKQHLVQGYQEKFVHYLVSGFDLTPISKLSGFEMYKQYYDQFPELVTFKDKLWHSTFGKSPRVYDALLRYRLFRINNYSIKTTFKY